MGNVCSGGNPSQRTDRVGLQNQAELLVTPISPSKSPISPTKSQTSPTKSQTESPNSPSKSQTEPPKSPSKSQKNLPQHVSPGASCDNESDNSIKENNPSGERIPGSSPPGENTPGATNNPETPLSGENIPGTTPPKSRHSPPVSRVASSSSSDAPHPSLSGLGSISMVWSRPEKWLEFREYLSSLDEGEDSDGRPMSLVRYADFLQMFARIEQGDENQRKQRVLDIADSEEDFFGRERGLKVVDGGMRKAVRGRIKAVREGGETAGGHVYKEVYTRVVDKLNLLLGVYQNVTLNKSK